MHIVPIESQAGFGAVVEDVDLTTLGASEITQLRDALLKYGLLIVRRQVLTPVQQIAVSEWFGQLETFPTTSSQIPGLPQIFRVASQAADGHVEVGRYWHSDGSFRAAPTPISLWYAVERAEQGGDTLFTDLQQAYRTLPTALRLRADGLETMHRNGVVHPLVMPHPHTGIPGIYLNIGLTGLIVGMTPQQSAQVIEEFGAHLSRPGATYTHAWEVGDFVVADNFHTAHQATPITPQLRRILNRTTVRADAVFWDAMDAH